MGGGNIKGESGIFCFSLKVKNKEQDKRKKRK